MLPVDGDRTIFDTVVDFYVTRRHIPKADVLHGLILEKLKFPFITLFLPLIFEHTLCMCGSKQFYPHCGEPFVECRSEREKLKRRKEKIMINERK
jgi:hypothetical protein